MPDAPRPAARRDRKLPRLWYDEQKDRWLILDGPARVNTKCRHGEGGTAQQKLIRYIEANAIPELTGKAAKRRPAERVACAEVIDYYLTKKEKEVARPKELGQRAKRLLQYWGDLNLDDVDGDSCDDFAEEVDSPSYARRMLADFQAAINMYRLAGFLKEDVKVKLPGAPDAREDFLSHQEALVLFRMARTERLDGRYVWRHLIPYLGVSIVSCTRASRVFRASFVPEKGRPHIDVRTGRYTRMWSGEKKTKKRAPDVTLEGPLLTVLRMLARDRTGLDGVVRPGLRYVCQYPNAKGDPKPVDPKRSFATIVRHAMRRHPDLFRRPDGEPKAIVRHSLRHTGITWMAMAGVDPYQIIRFAGITMTVFEDVYAHAFPGGLKAVQEWQRKAAKALE